MKADVERDPAVTQPVSEEVRSDKATLKVNRKSHKKDGAPIEQTWNFVLRLLLPPQKLRDVPALRLERGVRFQRRKESERLTFRVHAQHRKPRLERDSVRRIPDQPLRKLAHGSRRDARVRPQRTKNVPNLLQRAASHEALVDVIDEMRQVGGQERMELGRDGSGAVFGPFQGPAIPSGVGDWDRLSLERAPGRKRGTDPGVELGIFVRQGAGAGVVGEPCPEGRSSACPGRSKP